MIVADYVPHLVLIFVPLCLDSCRYQMFPFYPSFTSSFSFSFSSSSASPFLLFIPFNQSLFFHLKLRIKEKRKISINISLFLVDKFEPSSRWNKKRREKKVSFFIQQKHKSNTPLFIGGKLLNFCLFVVCRNQNI